MSKDTRRNSWFSIQKKIQASQVALEEYLGKYEEDLTVNAYGAEMFLMLEEAAQKIYEEEGCKRLESVYRGRLAGMLRSRGYSVEEDKNMCKIRKTSEVYRVDLYAEKGSERFLIEVKSRQFNRGFHQLSDYLGELDVCEGYLIGFLENGVRIYQMVQEESMIYLFDGKGIRKMNVLY